MAARCGLFLFILVFSLPCALEFAPELIVWNVGQGQWVTVIDREACWHFDMGGEFAPWRQITSLCRGRSNRVSLSHWDMDHINFVARARSHLPQLCIINRPHGVASERKVKWLTEIADCNGASPFEQWSDPQGKTANATSWVVSWRGVLTQGDSPRGQERIWIHKLRNLNQIHILILGHHGSRTSTSPDLLAALPRLRMAIASARKKRYGHPHAETIRALNAARIPILRTEEWGHLHIAL